MKRFIYETLITDPYKNLAVEDSLCQYVSSRAKCGEKICGLFLWQSDNAVVIGRNQNPARECDLEILQKNKVKLVRRLTGGGAVYHDLGNLNYSFISSESEASEEVNIQIIINALKNLGITAVNSGRNDIIVENLGKISGTAKKRYSHAFLHHGTLLISLNKDMAEQCLTPSCFKLVNKGVNSVRARIVNIGEIVRDCSVSAVKTSVINEFEAEYIQAEAFSPCFSDRYFIKSYNRLKDNKWIMGEDFPNYSIVQKDWGTIRFLILECNGYIKSIKYETDCIEVDFIARFFADLQGVELSRMNLLKYLQSINEIEIYNQQCICIASDIIEKILSEL